MYRSVRTKRQPQNRQRRVSWRWVAAGLIVLVGSAASCAGSDDDSAAPLPSTSETSTPNADVEATATTTPNGGPEAVPVDFGTLLESVIDDEPGPNGWHVPAGRWTTTAFTESVTFETPVDLTLRSISSRKIMFMNPADPDVKTVLVFTSSVSTPGADGTERPASRDAETLRNGLEAQPHITLLGEALLGDLQNGDEARSWDLVVDKPERTYPCWLGLRCVEIGVTAIGDRVSALADTTTRVYFVGEQQPRFRLFVMGEQDGFPNLASTADQIALSLIFSDDLPESQTSPEWVALGSLGLSRSDVPAGNYRTMMGNTLLEIDTPDGLPGFGLVIAGQETLVFITPSGFVSIFDPTKRVAADADQTLLLSDQVAPEDLISGRPKSTEDIQSWLSGLFEITATGELNIAGQPAPWWDTGSVLAGGQCPPDAPQAATTCAINAFSDHIYHWSVETDSVDGGRNVFLESGLVVQFPSIDGSFDAMVAELQPLLDALAVRAIPSG